MAQKEVPKNNWINGLSITIGATVLITIFSFINKNYVPPAVDIKINSLEEKVIVIEKVHNTESVEKALMKQDINYMKAGIDEIKQALRIKPKSE